MARKKKIVIKAWENKVKRLYACESLLESDLKYLNIQYDLYQKRKGLCGVSSFAVGVVLYLFPFIRELAIWRRLMIGSMVGFYLYFKLRNKNRLHYETIIMPYFEKYYIK